MLNGINAEEIFEMALGLERQGIQFYTRASEIFDDPLIKTMLLGLASMEADHERIFSAMRDRLVGEEFFSEGFDPEDLAARYLRAMTAGAVFEPMAPLFGGETLADILRRGIEAEKNSIVFYTGLRGLVPEDLGRDKVEAIIEEEMKHIVLLSDRLSSLKG